MWKHSNTVYIYRALDIGYSPDPTYCLWIAHLGDRYIAFKEKLWYKKVAEEVARDIVDDSAGMRIRATFCDPTLDINTPADVRSIKDIFEENGVPLECSVNNRELYAHAVHSALAKEVAPGIPQLQIYDKGCPYLIRVIPLQRYDVKNPLRMADHRDDHPVVTLAYFLISSGATERRTFDTTRVIPKWRMPKHTDHYILGQESVRDPLKPY